MQRDAAVAVQRHAAYLAKQYGKAKQSAKPQNMAKQSKAICNTEYGKAM